MSLRENESEKGRKCCIATGKVWISQPSYKGAGIPGLHESNRHDGVRGAISKRLYLILKGELGDGLSSNMCAGALLVTNLFIYLFGGKVVMKLG